MSFEKQVFFFFFFWPIRSGFYDLKVKLIGMNVYHRSAHKCLEVLHRLEALGLEDYRLLCAVPNDVF